MRILIDIGHPAHVHYFRNLYKELSSRHKLIVTCKRNPMVEVLLKHYGIDYILIGEKGRGVIGKLYKQMSFNRAIYNIIRREKVDIAMGVSASVVQAALLTQAKSIAFDDDDQSLQPFTRLCVAPYADYILSPDALAFENLKNTIYYPGYHELAYLHPKRWAPDPTVLEKYGVSITDKYFILRFVALKAHHDVFAVGLSTSQKLALINKLSQYGKVFITMESPLQPEFEPYRLPIAPHEMHDFLHFSQLLVCDGQTMCTEAAMLGTPSFRCNSFAGKVTVLEEEDKKYGLTYSYLPRQFDWMLNKIDELLKMDNCKDIMKLKRERMLNDKIDVTAFWAWLLDNFPGSINEIREPDFNFDRFK
jgi:uncharacterized protein